MDGQFASRHCQGGKDQRSDCARLEGQPDYQRPTQCTDDCGRHRVCHASQRARIDRHRHSVGRDPLAVHGQRTAGHAAGDPSRLVPVRVGERLGVRPACRQRPTGLADASGTDRRADRGVRPSRIAVAGSRRDSGDGRHRLLCRRPTTSGRRRHFGLRRRPDDRQGRHWVQRIDSVPQKGFYENSGIGIRSLRHSARRR